MKNKRISVVIPTHKRPDLLQRCLYALNNQTLHHSFFNVIIVNDGLDPETERVVIHLKKQLKMELHFLHTQVCKGPAAARNLGWLYAQSPLIAFTDDDCLPAPTWLEVITNTYERETNAVYSGKVIVPTSARPTDYEKNMACLERAEFITANCACTKHALYAVGGFDERFRMAWREDSDLHFKFLERQIPIVELENAVVIHPIRTAKWGISIKEQKKSIYNALLFKKFPTLYRLHIKQGTAKFYYILLFLLIVAIWMAIQQQFRAMSYVLLVWALLTSLFIVKRLKGARKSPSHLLEMICTSLVIPYLSIYWNLYGAFKFKVLKF